jgi:hypothetical protein
MKSKLSYPLLLSLGILGCGNEGEVGTDSEALTALTAQPTRASFISQVQAWLEHKHDAALYNFESGVQGWATSGNVLSAGDSGARAFNGQHSLALTFTGQSGTQDVQVMSPPVTAGETITAHVWVPANATFDAMQLFVLENRTWRWDATSVLASSLTANAWNTVQLTVPTSSAPIYSLGFEVSTRSSWRGTIYVDSISVVAPSGGGTGGGGAGGGTAATGGGTTSSNGGGTSSSGGGTAATGGGASSAGGGSAATGGGTAATGGGTGGTGGGMMTMGTPPLHVSGNHILNADGTRWHGRGANLNDTRSCNACTSQAPSVAEVERRIDELVDNWHASFIRLDLEAYASSDGYRNASNYQSVLYDPNYLADIRTIVQYIGTKPGVYVLVSLWEDPSIDSSTGWPTINPTTGTDTTWRKIAAALADQPQAMFGIINEPENNYDGSQDATVWSLMSQVVKAIRDTEDAAGAPYHIITVQGTGGWARRLGYYVTHPITERSGANIAYEVHVYNPQTDFASLFETYAPSLPIIIGEFGPMSGTMTAADCTALMDSAQSLEIPHMGWTFHMRCDPSMLADTSGGGCGIGMTLQPSAWGTQLKARLAQPW